MRPLLYAVGLTILGSTISVACLITKYDALPISLHFVRLIT